MEYALLDVTSNDPMPLVPEEMQHAIVGMTMQGGKVFVAEDKEAGEVRGILGVFPSYIPTALEIGMMYTFGDENAITPEFIKHVLTTLECDTLRCQMRDDPAREMVAALGFKQETTIYATDLADGDTEADIVSVAGDKFDYLTPEQVEQIRMLIRVGGAEEASFTGKPHTPSDEDIEIMLQTVKDAQVDLLLRIIDEKVVGLLAVEPCPGHATITCLTVHPEYRLQGIGRKLVNRAAIEYIRNDGELVLANVMECTPHLKEFAYSIKMVPVATVHKFVLSEEKEAA